MHPPQPCYLVEWYSPTFLGHTLAQTAEILGTTAVSMTADGAPVRVSSLIAVPEDEVVFGIFVAGSASAVSRTCDRAGFPAQRLTAATDVELARDES